MGRRRFTKAEREQVYQKCGGHCAYCGCPIAFEDYKHTLTVEEFRAYVSGIPARLMRDNIPYQVGVVIQRWSFILKNRTNRK